MATVLLVAASVGFLFILANFAGLTGSVPPLLNVLGLVTFPVASGVLTIWGLRVVEKAKMSDAEKRGWKDLILLTFGVGGYLAIREFLPGQSREAERVSVTAGMSQPASREINAAQGRPYRMSLYLAWLAIQVWCFSVATLCAALFGFLDDPVFKHIIPWDIGAAITSGTCLMVGGIKTLKALPLSEAERQKWRSWLIVGGVFTAFVLVFKSHSRPWNE